MTTTATTGTGRTDLVNRLRRNMATQDWVCLAFHTYMFVRVLLAPDSADATSARWFAGALLLITLAAILLGRGELLPRGKVRSLVYRLCIFAPVLLSYFELRELLAAVATRTYDAELEAIDHAIFGVSPAIWLQRFNRVPVIEWFSFFYYSYFFILAAVLAPSLSFERGRALREIMVGAAIVVSVGHVAYTLVPAFGPVGAHPFDEPTHGGFFFALVEHAVVEAGAQMDVFPSLHTALPTYLTLHCFGHRDRNPYRFAWPVLAFFAANIIVATLLLRWHWGIDVLAGLALAITARGIAVRVARREGARGVANARQPVWEPLWER